MKQNGHKRKPVAKEASDWFIANRAGLDAQQRKNFDEWLRAESEHMREYLNVTQVSGDLRRLRDKEEFSLDSLDSLIERARAEIEEEGEEADDDEDDAEHASRLAPRPARGWHLPPRVFQGLAAAAAMAVVGVLCFTLLRAYMNPVAPPGVPVTAQEFSTRHGEQSLQRLADGSVMHLNTDSTVRVAYANGARTVTLERGQVVFEVVHDASRPFRVLAGSAEIVDVGTKFDVYLQGDASQITVLEGRVSVTRKPGASALLLGAGEQVRVGSDGSAAVVERVDAQRATAWMQREIRFEHEPLAAVAAEFNRYTSTPIEISTPELGKVEISGAFNADDIESFVAFLRTLDGVQVEVREDRVLVSRR